jgi:hypothetical protein
MSRREWGEGASIMKLWITSFRDLPMEVVFVAQDRVFDTDEDANPETMLEPEVGPRLMPSVAAHLNAAVSVIGNTFIRRRIQIKEVGKNKKKEIPRIEYCLRIGPNPVYITKMRKPKKIKVPGVLVDPSYEEIISIIKGEE